ncbi:exopolyphosphatase [soil metagenome]
MCNVYLKQILFTGCILLLSSIQLFSQNNLKLKYKKSDVYAGIEVGSKGVKMSLVEISRNAQQKNIEFNILKDTSVNTDFISFTQPTFQSTLTGLTGLYRAAMTDYNISSDKIYTVVSSGVKIQAEKVDKAVWIKNLIDSFKIKIKEPRRQVAIIDVLQEAKLSHLGIVPESRRFNTFLIDIGSGNTKGGYFPNNNTNDFKLFQLSWGTKSTANATEKRLEDDKTMYNFNKQLYRVLAGQANDEIIYSVNLSGAYNMSDNIAFSGGIAWSVATLISPELIDNPVIPVTYEDVEGFYDKLYKNYTSFSDAEIVKTLADPTLNKVGISKEVQRVNKVFDQQSLMAGTGLLLKIMRQFEGIYEKKQFYLVKNGQVGWISAYVDQSINKPDQTVSK